jgi:hypothetical protein
MSIIKPKPKQDRAQIRIHVDSQVLSEISRYCEYAGFKKQDEFFEEAALHILTKDKDFKEWKEASIKPVNAE